MKSSQKNVAMGFAAGLVLGAVVLTSFGQNANKTKKETDRKTTTSTPKSSSSRSYTVPRYSVQYDSSQDLLLITDNAYSRLFLYDTTGSGASTLRSYIDLRQTGARQLRAVPSRSGASSKAKGAKPKATKKPNPKKKSPKKKG